jgi:acyl-CoA synthetase (AMP-forming)/AMP-acid ligase II
VTTPLDASTLAELAELLADRYGEKTALYTEEQSITFEALNADSSRLAKALASAGIAPGDRVVIIARDSVPLALTLFGAAKAQAVWVCVNWRLHAVEIGHVLADAQPRAIFFAREFADTVQVALASSGVVPQVLVSLDGAGGLRDWFGSFPPRPPPLTHRTDDAVVQLYTSGTTGAPKGVELANRTFFAIAREMAARGDPWMGWSEADVNLQFVPTSHIGGLWWLVRSLALGASNVLLDRFDAQRILETIPRMRVTKTAMVPAMLQVLLAEPECERVDFSSLKTVLYGAAPIAPALLERARDVLRCDFCQIYGMTETGNMAVSLRPEDHWTGPPQRLMAAGKPLPGVSVRVVGPDGTDVARGVVGEIAIRSPAQMLGYWKRPEATNATVRDGWIMTGDGGYVDDEGYVYVCDRLKDMIICAGENIYPSEVENAIRTHEGVSDVAVIGVPHALWGESVMAFVVPRTEGSIRQNDLIRHARSRLADFKLPQSIEFVSQLPRNASGKILKNVLRDPYWKGRSRKIN